MLFRSALAAEKALSDRIDSIDVSEFDPTDLKSELNTTITNKVKVEETRALAAEKALSDRIDAIGDYGLIEGTYDEIYMLWWKGELIPGRKYAINDYECCYIHPSGGTDEKIELRHAATDVVYIILTATSTDKFDYNVQYIRTGSKPKIIE